MSADRFDDETLMAFADGALDEPTRSAVERALAQDEALAERVALFLDTRGAAKAALAPLLALDADGRALEARVAAMVRDAEAGPAPEATDARVLPFRPPPAASRPSRRWALPLAASIALAFGLGGATGWLVAPDGRTPGLLAGASVARALLETPAGAETRLDDGRVLRAVASFRDATGALCREVEIDEPTRSESLVTVACREGADWSLRFAVAVPSAEGGYAPASSLDALDAWLAAVGAGEPMEPADEAAALARAARE